MTETPGTRLGAGRFLCMQRSSRTLLFSVTAALFALGAANAYAAGDDNAAHAKAASVSWIVPKTAITESSAIIRQDEVPASPVIPLRTDFKVRVGDAPKLRSVSTYDREVDLRDFDLIEDSPMFIGAQGATEFDTLEARRDSGSYPAEMGVDPLFPVAGAGLSTSF